MKIIEFSEPLCKGATAFDRIAFLQEKIRESDDSEIVIRMENGGANRTYICIFDRMSSFIRRKI